MWCDDLRPIIKPVPYPDEEATARGDGDDGHAPVSNCRLGISYNSIFPTRSKKNGFIDKLYK